MVLLHGQPGSGAAWNALSVHLEDRFRVLAPDRIGYGSTVGEARGLGANAELIASFLVEREAVPATVVAHSWAGGAAVLLADRHPELVSRLVLVGAACTPDSLNALDRWLTLPAVGSALTVAGLVGIGAVLPRLTPLVRFVPARYRRQVTTALPDRGALGGERGALGRHRRTFLIEQQALNDELPEVTEALGRLDLPVAVVSGQWDLVVPPRASVSLARAVRGAEFTMLPTAGHFVARDDPVGLAGVIHRAAGIDAGSGRPGFS